MAYHVSTPVSKEYQIRVLKTASKLTQRDSEIQTTAYEKLTPTSRPPVGLDCSRVNKQPIIKMSTILEKARVVINIHYIIMRDVIMRIIKIGLTQI